MMRRNVGNRDGYRYGFQGQEKDNEIKGSGNSINFGARMLDTRLGRFMSLDPYARLSTGISLYSFAGNNPILFIDYDGKFKYPKGSTQEKDYPKLTNYLKNTVQEIANNPKVMKALAKYSELSESDIKKALTWGEGPTIKVTSLDKAYGEFTPGIKSDELRVDTDLIKSLESSEGDDSDAKLFLTAVTILHEFTHYGDDQDGKQQTDKDGNRIEEGLEFEKEAYGKVITGSNAEKSIEDWKGK